MAEGEVAALFQENVVCDTNWRVQIFKNVVFAILCLFEKSAIDTDVSIDIGPDLKVTNARGIRDHKITSLTAGVWDDFRYDVRYVAEIP
jgi:hypothetical protein